ncbi:hypothetical protein GCM10008018_30970 [Paenibacillus marchantiophytorum]|uniref:Uncharacterized protein n=1 Tax=Paenibacillus marchantiophytorum TaxID=1619310 RepID=A0ABQ1EQS7_9BACL|nr:hypothetical protein GCM10008018_30970 [Paenibacillus marchantiophytorum]
MEAFFFNQRHKCCKMKFEIHKLWRQYGDNLGKHEEFPSLQEVKIGLPKTIDSADLKKLEGAYSYFKAKKGGENIRN